MGNEREGREDASSYPTGSRYHRNEPILHYLLVFGRNGQESCDHHGEKGRLRGEEGSLVWAEIDAAKQNPHFGLHFRM